MYCQEIVYMHNMHLDEYYCKGIVTIFHDTLFWIVFGLKDFDIDPGICQIHLIYCITQRIF